MPGGSQKHTNIFIGNEDVHLMPKLKTTVFIYVDSNNTTEIDSAGLHFYRYMYFIM